MRRPYVGLLLMAGMYMIAADGDLQRASPCTWPSDSVANCSGKDITDLPVVGFTFAVMDLDLSYNKITTLTKEAVDRLGKVGQLLFLNFSHNLIKHIDEDSFKEGLMWLEVDLSWNRLMSISPNTFIHNTNLQKLSLAGNTQLILIPSGNSLISRSLLHLDISHCGLSNIPDNTFSSVKRLQKLDLSHNNITSVNPEILSQFFELNLIDVSYNRLEMLEIDTLSQLLIDKNIESGNIMKLDVATTTDLRIEGNPWLCDCKMYQVYEWCKRKQWQLPVICQIPQKLSQQSWEALASENCTTTTTTTHYYPSTESPMIVSASISRDQTMGSIIVVVVFLLSVVGSIISTVTYFTFVRDQSSINDIHESDLKVTYIPDSIDQQIIDHTYVDPTSDKPLLQGISNISEHHTPPTTSTLSLSSISRTKYVDVERGWSSNMEDIEMFSFVQY